MGNVIAHGNDFLLVEGLHKRTKRSHALKLLNKGSTRPRHRSSSHLPKGDWSHRLSQCLEDVYEGPNHICLVMRWGTHEVDKEHDLSSAILEALRLLSEVMPATGDAPSEEGLRLNAVDTAKLMHRVLTLDTHLQANLFI